MSQYFDNNDHLEDDYKIINFTINNINLKLETNSGIFSKNRIDFGTNLLLNEINLDHNPKKIIDMGCGYGIIGIYLKKVFPKSLVFLYDINQKAIKQSVKNGILNSVDINCFVSDFFEKVDYKADLIVSNPPIRIGKQKVFDMYYKAYDALEDMGYFYAVVGNKQGSNSHYNKIKEIFNNVETIKKKGYWIIKAKK